MADLVRKVNGRATYKATQLLHTLFLFATGEMPSHYYRASLERALTEVFPPEYILYFIAPAAEIPEIHVPWPFHVQVSFHSEKPIDQIKVHDEDGTHEVPVQQVKAA